MNIFKKVDKWGFAALLIILTTFILLIIRLDMFPKFIDIYYHFSVAKAFEIANGIVLHDFWEYAPSGRPHLYPPLFHIFILILTKIGFKIEFLLKAVSLAIFPLLQFTSWAFFKKIFNKKIAFYIVLLISSSYSFYWFQTNMIPASLVIIFSILIYYLIEREKFISASILLALSFYTHSGLSSIITLSLVVYGLLRKDRLKIVLKIVSLAMLLFSPWLFHFLMNLDFLSVGNQANFIEWKLHFLLLFFAISGSFYCIKLKKEMFIPISYALAMVPFLFFYPSIYFSGHNLFSWSLLGGVFLGNINKISLFKNKKYAIAIISILVLLITPVIVVPKNSDDTIKLKLEKGIIANLIFYEPKFEDLNLLNENNLELVSYINENTDVDTTFYIQNAYLGGFITAFTGRSQVGAMYHEVKPIEVPSKRNAYIWINEINDPEPPKDFKLVKEMSGYKIYKKDNAESKRKIPLFKVPLIFAYTILIIGFLAIYFDLKR